MDDLRGTWTLDHEATLIGFRAPLVFGFSVTGRFGRFESAIEVGPSVTASSVAVTVWTDSVDTGMRKRDEHIRADRLLAAEPYPVMEFRSTEVRETPAGLAVTGALRVRDRVRTVTFDAVRSSTPGPPRYTAEFVVSPTDHGITRRGATKPVTVVVDAVLTRP